MVGQYRMARYLGEHWKRIREYVQGDYSELTDSERKARVEDAVRISAIAAGAVVTIPVPFADIWTITPVQILMVRAIGNLYGIKLTAKTAQEIVSVIATGWLGKQVFLGLLKIGMPGAGGVVGAGFAYYWTLGIGKAATKYFKRNLHRPLPGSTQPALDTRATEDYNTPEPQ